ncbi:MAG: hypothetical protein ACREKH_15920 [Candidatus Rokuibacteriota bacterium]
MPSDEHPRREARRLGAGQADAEEARRAVRHLLAGCPSCGLAMQRGWRADHRRSGSEKVVLDRAVARSEELAALVGRESAAAATLVAELKRHPQPRALTLINNSPRFRRRAVCEVLIAASVSARHDSPAETFRFAELAVAVADQLTDREATEVQAAAWAELGNARRLMVDLAGAEAALERALGLAEEAAVPQLEAECLLTLGVLRVDQRRFAQALRLYRRAKHLYEGLCDRSGVARCLFQIGKAHGDAGDPAAGLHSIWAGLRMLGPDSDPELVFLPVHNLVLLIEEAGGSRAAAGLLEAARPLYEAYAGEVDLARLDWLRARIQIGLGMLDDAGFLLESLRQRFAEHDLSYDAALVSLDLATVYARQRRTFELRVLLGQAIPIFQNLGVTRETLAGIALLRQTAVRSGRALELIRQLAQELEAKRPDGRQFKV